MERQWRGHICAARCPRLRRFAPSARLRAAAPRKGGTCAFGFTPEKLCLHVTAPSSEEYVEGRSVRVNHGNLRGGYEDFPRRPPSAAQARRSAQCRTRHTCRRILIEVYHPTTHCTTVGGDSSRQAHRAGCANETHVLKTHPHRRLSGFWPSQDTPSPTWSCQRPDKGQRQHRGCDQPRTPLAIGRFGRSAGHAKPRVPRCSL